VVVGEGKQLARLLLLPLLLVMMMRLGERGLLKR
jgi:hypothetical protein